MIQLVVVAGANKGEVITWREDAAPRNIKLSFAHDLILGKIYIEYRLLCLDNKEAFYVPAAMSDMQAIRELIK